MEHDAVSTTGYELKSSAYDRVSSLLISLLVLIGAAVLLLFAIWLTMQMFPKKVSAPVVMQQIGDGGGLGDDSELDPDVEQAGLETEFDEPELQDTLASIVDAVSDNAAVIEDPLWNQGPTGKSGPRGDGRIPGNGNGKPGVMRHWEVRFIEGGTLTLYAQQLDYFGIELGVIQPGGQVDYAWRFSDPKPRSRSGSTGDEKRYYLTWRNGPLEATDRELLERADIESGNRPVLKFLSPELEGQLAGMEKQFAGKMADKVRATYFGVQPRGKDEFEFYIDDQVYRY